MNAMPELDKFLRWIARARRGQAYVYHVGSLMYDRDHATNREKFRQIDAIGAAAWALHEQKKVTLTQRKVGPLCFEYRATAA